MLRESGSVDWAWFVLNVCDSPICLERLGLRRTDFSRFFWYFVARQWAQFDRIPHERFATEFKKHRAGWEPEIMTWGHPKGNDNIKTYRTLPDPITIYRGQGFDQSIGLSWTLDIDVASAFAMGLPGARNSDPVILSLTVTRKDIAFVVNEREQAELVLFTPPKRKHCEIMSHEMADFADAR
jgi:hypothetical protein